MHRYIQGSVAQPAAGADLSEIPNYGDAFRLLTLHAKFVTSATVANRYPHFQFVSPSGEIIHEVVPSAAQVAGATTYYDLCGGNGASFDGTAVHDNVVSLSLPDFWFPAGTKVLTLTTGIAAGDQWSSIFWSALVGEEWQHLRLLEEIAAQIGG